MSGIPFEPVTDEKIARLRKEQKRRHRRQALADIAWSLPMALLVLLGPLISRPLCGDPWAVPVGVLVAWLVCIEVKQRREARKRAVREATGNVGALVGGFLGGMAGLAANSAIRYFDACPVCGGHGRFDDVPCPRCDGTGRKGKEVVQ